MSDESRFLEDERLVRGVREGDGRSVERFGIRLQCVPRILAAQNARLGRPLGPEDLADLAQEVSLVVWRKLEEYTPQGTLEGWIYRISFLEMMNHLRKRRRQQQRLGQVIEEEARRLAAPVLARAERYEQIHRGLELLEAEEAAVIRLKHFDELTFGEVGEALGLPLGTVKTRYYRGLVKLKEFLRNHGREDERDRIASPGARALDRGAARQPS